MDYILEQVKVYVSEDLIWQWVAVAGAALGASFLLKFISLLITARLRKLAERTISIWDDVAIDIIDGLKSWVLFICLFSVFSVSLNPSDFGEQLLKALVVFACVFQIGIWGLYLIRIWHEKYLSKKVEADPSSAAALSLLYTSIKAIFISIIILIGLSNLGINVSAMIAGLGVGGIAVALAAQNVLGDLLASLSIALDKPFVVGDFVVTGEELGTVEYIGIKTTRVRSLSGEQLVFSNKDLLETRLRNYQQMWERRVVQSFGVVYSTSAEALEQIPKWVKEFVDQEEGLRFDRCHFAKYGDSSLDFELVFFVLNPDYNIYMTLQEKVLLKIFKKFRDEGIDFAFPTRSVYVEKVPVPKLTSNEEFPKTQ